jgi:hypothetical protein
MKWKVGCDLNIAVMYEDSGVRDLNCPRFRFLKCARALSIFFGQNYDEPVYVVM